MSHIVKLADLPPKLESLDLILDKIVEGDCLELMRRMPDECVGAVVMGPPYGTQELGGGYGRRQLHSKDGRLGRTIANDCDLSMVAAASPELFRLLRCDSWLFSFCAARRMIETANLFTTAAFSFYGELIWDKGAPGLGYTIRYVHESALVFCKGSPEKAGEPILSLVRAWVDRADTHSRHPHEKPEAAMTRMISLVSGTIFDPFIGSGTSAVSARKLGRHFVGCEINPDYCKIAEKRLLELDAQPELFTPQESAAVQRPLLERGHD